MKAWPEEREQALRDMWARGLSGGQIATMLGVSRDAVLGKANRLGLSREEQRRKRALRNAVMRRIRDEEGLSYREIGERFGLTGVGAMLAIETGILRQVINLEANRIRQRINYRRKTLDD